MLPLDDSTIARFWSKVDRSGGPDACWPWMAGRDKDGYGKFKVNGKTYRAHRIAWMIGNGPIPDGLCGCHSCDNPPCCNPAHGWAGTNADNARDRNLKGRTRLGGPQQYPNWKPATGDRNGTRTKPESRPRGDNHPFRRLPDIVPRGAAHWTNRNPERWYGENNPSVKLTDAQCEEIRELYASGTISQDKIALLYGVGQSQISRIVRKQSRVGF